MGKTLFEKIWEKHLVKTIPVQGEQGMVDIKKPACCKDMIILII